MTDIIRRAFLKNSAAAAAMLPVAGFAQAGDSDEIQVANTFDETKIDWKPLPGPDGEPTEHVSLSFFEHRRESKSNRYLI